MIFFILSGLSLTSVAWAESNSSDRWTLDRMIRRAVEASPDLKALNQDIIRAENLARQAGKWDNPDASVSYGPMNQAGLSGSSLDFSLKQSIPLFGQKAIAEKIGEQNKATTEIDSTSRILSLKHEVARITYRLAAINEQTKHIVHRREKIGLIAKYLETRPFASPSQAVEKNLIINRLREIEDKFLEISGAKERVWQALNIFVALEKPITPDVKWTDVKQTPDHDKIWKLCQSQNPELKRQESVIATTALEIDQAGKKRFPDIRIGAGYNEQTADLPQRVYAGTIEFSIPILDRGGYAKQAALAEKESQTYRMDQKRRELSAQFEQAWSSLTQSKKRIELYPISLVEKLESQMQKAEQNWKKGLVPVTAFLELENQVHEQAVKVFDAQTSYVEALSQVLLLAGSEFSAEEK